MTITSDLHPARLTASPMGAILSTPDLKKLYMSASCPDLKAESIVSSEDEDLSDSERFEPLDTHDEAALSMDSVGEEDSNNFETQADPENEKDPANGTQSPTIGTPALRPSVSSLSSASGASSTSSDPSSRRKLQWEFKGLTLWLELEEFDADLTRACEDLSARHSSPAIPKPHTTAIYGMEHLTVDEARRRLAAVRERIPRWPSFARPTGVTSDVAVCGRPGQVCSIAWSELTLATSPAHEDALDALYRIFYDDSDDGKGGGASSVPSRDRPWKPHNSIAYDNPETNALSLLDTVVYASSRPSLLGRGRRVEALSLWSTEGKMEEWECIDRVRFW